MRSHSVKMLVIAPLPFQCEFRPNSEGWIAECHDPPLQVHGSSFEDAKRNMEAALQSQVMSVLRERGMMAA
jgi:hypothetical protein